MGTTRTDRASGADGVGSEDLVQVDSYGLSPLVPEYRVGCRTGGRMRQARPKIAQPERKASERCAVVPYLRCGCARCWPLKYYLCAATPQRNGSIPPAVRDGTAVDQHQTRRDRRNQYDIIGPGGRPHHERWTRGRRSCGDCGGKRGHHPHDL